jgi:hypothetical protein
MVLLEDGKTYRVRYFVKVGDGNAEPREGAMNVERGIAVLLHSNLQGRIERMTVDAAQLAPSDDPDVDFIYLGPALEASI